MMKKLLILIFAFVQITSLYSQEKKRVIEGYLTEAERKADVPFKERFNTSARGNITFIANNILNRPPANTPYDGNGFNNNFDLQYIDTDGFVDENGDGNDDTFSSSKATLQLPDCSKVEYAGLYWAGIYPFDNWNEEAPGAPITRDDDFNEIKFKLPGDVNYRNIIAEKFDPTATIRELIYDGGADRDQEKPYVCYKDITAMVKTLTAGVGSVANGEYVAANIKATLGEDNVGSGLGSSAGWAMVVIYKNEGETNKKFYVFDGFSTIKAATNPFTDVPITGFQTVPSGPVRANLLVAALEGDKAINGDAFQIERRNTGAFETLTTGNLNGTNNFFNGSITAFNNHLTNRVPDSENTLGFDTDLFSLNNPGKTILNNGQTNTTLRFTTSGDSYWPFLLGMSVEIIEPKVQLIKTIENAAGVDISGDPVGLGAELFYNIRFQNIGTDNAKNTEIFDVLPKNVDFLPADLILPPELESTRAQILSDYEPPVAGNGFRGKLTFKVPDNLVIEGGNFYDIKIKVKVVSNCNDLRDVCSNRILNQAFASYESDKGGADPVNGEESFAGLDSCKFGIVGISNFLVDIDGCDFRRTEILCGSSLDITAGNGFDTYQWVDQAGNNVGSTQTITVTAPGVYTVTKTTTLGCITKPEIITVVSFNNEPNPITPFADQVLTSCPSNSFELAEIYLCGTGTREIRLPFTGATTVRWFKLDETIACSTAVAGCANIDTGCTWTDEGIDLNKTFSDAGQYRLEVLYDGRCPKTYYFNVFKATLNPTIVKEDILCSSTADITINGVPSGYEYMLTGPGIATPAFQTSNVFTVTAAGDYNYTIRLIGSPAASCTYTFPPVNIQSKDIGLNIVPTNMECAGEPAEIEIQVTNVPGDYTYTLTQGGATIATSGPTPNGVHSFNVTDGGLYEVTVTTSECTITETTSITKPAEITLSAVTTKNISCKDGASNGIITLSGSGGTLVSGDNYSFAVVSIDGVAVTTKTYFSNTTFNVALGDEGVYVFEILDSNDCTTTATATVAIEPELQFNHTATDISCNGLTDGRIDVSVNGSDLGFNPIEYSIDAGTTWDTTGIFTGLPVDTYTISIRASKINYQCTYEIRDIEIREPLALTGGSATKTDLSCDASGNTILGSITFVAPAGGTGVYTYYYKLTANATYTTATSNPVTNLPAGTYNTRVTDANGCLRELNDVTIDAIPGSPTFNSSIIYNCAGEGNITITPFNASYTYTLDTGTPQTGANANIFENVTVGAHTIRVNYFGNCRIDIPVTIQPGNEFLGV